MKPLTILSGLSLLLLAACGPNSAEQAASSENDATALGEVHIEVTGSPEAMPPFERGLLLLHSFEYQDAAEAFQEAQRIDPSFAMAYWGEAMTYHKPLWQTQNYEKGRSAMAGLGATPEERLAKAGNELERDLLAALEIIYGEGTKAERDKAYADYMAGLYEKYPGNHEIAAFYALSLMGSVPSGRDEAVYGRSAAIAQGIIEENPQHPGALHYLIHAYDDPDHAVGALTAADRYSKVAPDAAHALHMPSHIYVAMGMWDEVVRSNIDSYSASVDRMHRKGLTSSARSYHAFHWLMYGYLQQGQLEAARTVLDSAVAYIQADPTAGARSYFVRMKANYLAETGDWTGWAAGIDSPYDDLNIENQAQGFFAEAMSAIEGGETAEAAELLTRLETAIANASQLVGEDGAAMCSAGGSISRNAPSRSDVEKAQVMALEIKALLAEAYGQSAIAEQRLQEAVALEKETTYSYGPPSVPYPSFELYGDWLLEQGRAEEALRQFDYALQRGPNRLRALRGKLRAAEMAGDRNTAAETAEQLKALQRAEPAGWLT